MKLRPILHFNAKKDETSSKREIVVLVVEKPPLAMEWSLYGYERETTPRLSKQDGLVHFTDVIT